MPSWKRRLVGFGLPCLLAFSFDVGLTLYGQPAEYWAGDYRQTTEGAPFFRRLYQIHPLAATAGDILWAAIILTWVLLLPEVLAVILTIAVVFGHTAGGYTWLGFGLECRWFQTLHGVLFISASGLGAGMYWALWSDTLDRRTPNLMGLRPVFRWSLLAVATAIACYMFLIPQ
jgi:hypothetical protein